MFYKNIKDDPSIPKWGSAVFFLVIMGFIGMLVYFLYFAIINGSEYINNLDDFSIIIETPNSVISSGTRKNPISYKDGFVKFYFENKKNTKLLLWIMD